MKRIILIILALSLIPSIASAGHLQDSIKRVIAFRNFSTAAAGGGSTPTYVNSNHGYSSGPITLTGVTAGNLLVAFVSGGAALTTTTISGWTKLTPRVDGGPSNYSCIYYLENASGGDLSVAITNPPSDPGWSVHEYSGVPTSSSYIGENYGYGGYDANPVTSAAITTTTPAVIACVTSNEAADSTHSYASPATGRTSQSDHAHYTGDRLETTGGDYSVTSNKSATSWYLVNCAAFKGQ